MLPGAWEPKAWVVRQGLREIIWVRHFASSISSTWDAPPPPPNAQATSHPSRYGPNSMWRFYFSSPAFINLSFYLIRAVPPSMEVSDTYVFWNEPWKPAHQHRNPPLPLSQLTFPSMCIFLGFLCCLFLSREGRCDQKAWKGQTVIKNVVSLLYPQILVSTERITSVDKNIWGKKFQEVPKAKLEFAARRWLFT